MRRRISGAPESGSMRRTSCAKSACAIERRDSQLAQAHVRNHLSKVKDAVLMGLAKGFDPSVELRNAREGYTIRPHGE